MVSPFFILRHAELSKAQLETSHMRNMSNHSESLEHLKKMLQLHEDLMDNVGIAKSCYDIGYALTNLDKFDESLEYLKKALALQEKLDNKAGIGKTCAIIGKVFALTRKLDESLTYLRRSLKIRMNMNDIGGMLTNYLSIAKVLDLQGKHEEALKSIYDGQNLLKQIESETGYRHPLTYDFATMLEKFSELS